MISTTLLLFFFLDPSATLTSHRPFLVSPLVSALVSPRVPAKTEPNTKGEQTVRKDAKARITPLSK